MHLGAKTDAPSPRVGARELARRAMREQIARLALDLFAERGYDSTTVDDVCAAAGISRTTFFRYFGNKEDVLMRDFNALGDVLAVALTEQPDDQSAWSALRDAIGALASQYSADDQRTRRALQVVIDTPSLTAFHHEKLSRWNAQLRPEVARRLGANPEDLTDPAPAALIAAGFACLDAALAAWVAAQGTADLSALLSRATAALD